MANKKSLGKIFLLLTGILVISISYGWAISGKSSSRIGKDIHSRKENLNTKKSAMKLYSPSGGEKPAEKVYKNIKVFKGLPVSRLIPTMRFIEAALGTNCGNCHVHDKTKGWEFDSDKKPGKKKARKMIEMMNDINEHHFMGHQEVTCFTCHNGQLNPETVPALLKLPLKREDRNDKDIIVANRLNTAGEIVAKYVKAIGGKEAFQKIASLKFEGTTLNEDGKETPITIYQKAPDKILTIGQNHWGEFSRGFNGEAGWFKAGQSEDSIKGDDLNLLKDAAEFYRNINIDKDYSKLRFSNVVVVDGDTAYEVKGSLTQYLSDKLYFDVNTGLLIRKIQYNQTPLGDIQVQTDYKDYKNVDGVLIPYTLHTAGYDFNQTMSYSNITANTEIADKMFDMPAK
ncbi:MAG: c-type cytochrome [Ignavibacteriaceae bacterium]